MNVTIANRQRRLKVETKRLKAAAVKILNALECTSRELSISLVGDRSIRIINREYLNKDRPTNVISFAMQEGECSGINPDILGDVVISVDTALKEADAAGVSLYERLVFLLLHGILHLAGYDHERSGEKEARRMEAREKQLFALLKTEGFV